jgi:hypothetical protein
MIGPETAGRPSQGGHLARVGGQLAFLCILAAAGMDSLAAASDLLIENATLIDGTTSPPRTGLSILIREGRIVEIAESIAASDVHVLNAEGLTVIPGLIDSHVHLASVPGSASPRRLVPWRWESEPIWCCCVRIHWKTQRPSAPLRSPSWTALLEVPKLGWTHRIEPRSRDSSSATPLGRVGEPKLFENDRHEALLATQWNESEARTAIERIVKATAEDFTSEGLWPVHPLDLPDAKDPLRMLYFGAAGVIWALDYLHCEGETAPPPDFEEALSDLLEANRGTRLGKLDGYRMQLSLQAGGGVFSPTASHRSVGRKAWAAQSDCHPTGRS